MGSTVGWHCFNLRCVNSGLLDVQGQLDIEIQELQVEAADDLDKLMSLDELEDKFSDKLVKFTLLNVKEDGHDYDDV